MADIEQWTDDICRLNIVNVIWYKIVASVFISFKKLLPQKLTNIIQDQSLGFIGHIVI